MLCEVRELDTAYDNDKDNIDDDYAAGLPSAWLIATLGCWLRVKGRPCRTKTKTKYCCAVTGKRPKVTSCSNWKISRPKTLELRV